MDLKFNGYALPIEKIKFKVDGEEAIIPAVVADQITTPDYHIFGTCSPSSIYINNVLLHDGGIGDVKMERMVIIKRILLSRYKTSFKQLVITAFNMVNNPIDTPNAIPLPLKDMSIYRNDSCDFNREPSRPTQELFTNRETLDLILRTIDELPEFEYVDLAYNNEDTLFEYTVYIISRIYDVCLNRVDSERDVINFTSFMSNLSYTSHKFTHCIFGEINAIYNLYYNNMTV